MADPIGLLSQRVGIVGSYTDQLRRRRRTGRGTQLSLLAAMGLDVATEAQAADVLRTIDARDQGRLLPRWMVVTADTRPAIALPADAEWALTCEDGSTQEGRGADGLPVLPLGLHRLTCKGHATWLITAPDRIPAPRRSWGVTLPLYGLRTADQGGVADFEDLARAGESLAQAGAAFVGLNPIHAGFPCDASGYSPYTPSHRRRLSVFHIPTEAPDAAGAAIIDWSAEIPAKMAALRAAFDAWRNERADDGFRDWRRAQGGSLDRFALHQALSERHGAYWSEWPAALQDPASSTVADEARSLQAEIDFHAWLQWRAETELAKAQGRMKAAGMGLGLYLDLAVGTHPAGAETWEDRESFAYGASLGAPPDAFSADGQAWGVAPFNPERLIETGFRPLAETLRRQLTFAGALRIDHVLGFERAFWVPNDRSLPGAYVRMPREAMLAVVRLEAARAGAIVVGEDLGNVPRGLRARMAASGLLGCRVQMFEQRGDDTPRFRSPDRYPREAIASFSTHDLPTWTGWRQGHDIETHAGLGHIDDAARRRLDARRAAEVAAFDDMTAACAPEGSAPDAPERMHHALAATRSDLVAVQIENALGIVPQPNLPGTVDEYPNWRQRLPVPAGSLGSAPGLVSAAAIMRANRR